MYWVSSVGVLWYRLSVYFVSSVGVFSFRLMPHFIILSDDITDGQIMRQMRCENVYAKELLLRLML